MALLGSPFDNEDCDSSVAFPSCKDNPKFTIDDFTFWIPDYESYCKTQDGIKMFNKLKRLANSKILYSVFGTDWEMAMSLCIAHYATIIGKQKQLPAGQTLAEASSRGGSTGVLTGMTLGNFGKTYDLERSMSDSTDARFWNQTKYGQQLYNLFESKGVFTILVVTSDYVPGSGNL